jgi:hypothetical protein
MYCRKPNGVLANLDAGKYKHCSNGRIDAAGQSSAKCGGWKYFYANCPKTNVLCSAMSGGWVAAITVCGQRLF